MKVVILAGGLGSRLSEETDLKPKPMVEIGGMPILWHIMKIYSNNGFNEFIICLGYKGFIIKEFFANYFVHRSDVTIDLKKNDFKVHSTDIEPWKVTLVDTGLNTMTGGRIKRIREHTGGKKFLLTYGDGVADININKLIESHENSKKICTVSSVQPSGRFGTMVISKNNEVLRFQEKPDGDGMWINAGFMVCEQEVFDYIDGDETVFEQSPLERLAIDNKMNAYRHKGFWRAMDTLKDKNDLNDLWRKGMPKWKTWS